MSEDGPQGEWDKIAEQMMLTFAESGHPVFRSTSPLSGGKLSIHYCADPETIETVFRTINSVIQLSMYGAVAEMCEEYETLHDRSEQPVLGGQSSSSLVLSVIKTEVPLDGDDRAHEDLLFLGPGSEQKWWPGGWGPQGMPLTGGGGLARVPNLRVCNHLFFLGVAHAGGEG